MADNRWSVGGRRFQSKKEYQAALRDQQKIRAIKQKINFKNSVQVIQFYDKMQSAGLKFESQLGIDFQDELYELYQKYKQQNSKNTAGAGKNPVKTKEGKQKTEEVVKLDDCDEKLKSEILYQLQRREKRRKLLIVLCSILAVVCLGYVAVYSFFTQRTARDAQALAELKNKNSSFLGAGVVHKTGDVEVPEVLDEYKSLYNKNKSLIGWVKIADTNIDYPVMQSANSEYYLTHNFNQEYDKNGSIFLDSECDVIKRNTNLIVYGHHMKSGKMFGNLDHYSQKKYYEKHPIIEFDTIYEKGKYQIMYVFRSRIYYEDEIVFKYYQFTDANSAEEFDYNMQEMSKLSLYDTGITASYGDELLTLSTCDNSEEAGRFVVVAKRIE